MTVEPHGTPVVTRTDPVRLRQILDGLLDNALRVTPRARPIVLAWWVEPSWSVLQVRDGGPGLADEDIAVAFDRAALHARYGDERAGTAGVGLALVAGLAERLGGTIQASHAPEGGAAFTVRLPLERDAATPLHDSNMTPNAS